MVCGCLTGTGLFLTSFAPTIYVTYLTFGVLAGTITLVVIDFHDSMIMTHVLLFYLAICLLKCSFSRQQG